MKKILVLALAALSINVFAFEQKASLDFTNLYGNTNAGFYEMKVSFESKKTVSESKLSFNTEYDDHEIKCVTSASFEIGTMKLTLVNVNTSWTKTVENKLVASVSVQSDDETCETDIEKFAGNQVVYTQVGPQLPFILPVKAPFDYQTVGAYVSPFNGYLHLNTNLEVKGDKLVMNPAELLTETSIRSTNINNASVTYYVYATKDATTLSLGTGLIKF